MPGNATDGALAIDCRTCGAGIVVPPDLRTAECPYCGSPAVVARPPAPDRPAPAFVLGFVVDRERAVRIAQRWLRTRGAFAPSALKRAAPTQVRGVYVPAYLYGAAVCSDFAAEIGEDYTETETYTTTDAQGRTVRRTRTVTKTEWRPLAGRHERWLADVIVTASRGVTNAELEEVEPFDLRALRRYTPAALAGWIAEEPSRTREECRRLAHEECLAAIGGELAAFLPGDHHRELSFQATVADEIADLVLLPLWIFAVRYAPGAPPVRLLINGQTGEAAGRAPRSPLKIAGAAGIALVLAGLLALLVLLAVSGR
ncbi:MAG: hypothetical protein AB1726_17115 [Planctomycetota bacterium]